MVLMTVGQDQCHDPVQLVFQIAQIGQDEIDTRLGLLGKQDTAVHNQNLIIEFEDGHVATDFAQTTERDDS